MLKAIFWMIAGVLLFGFLAVGMSGKPDPEAATRRAYNEGIARQDRNRVMDQFRESSRDISQGVRDLTHR